MRMFLFLLLGSMFMTIKGQVPNTICQGLQQSISHCQQVCSSSTYYQQSCPQECNLCLAALTGGGIGGMRFYYFFFMYFTKVLFSEMK